MTTSRSVGSLKTAFLKHPQEFEQKFGLRFCARLAAASHSDYAARRRQRTNRSCLVFTLVGIRGYSRRGRKSPRVCWRRARARLQLCISMRRRHVEPHVRVDSRLYAMQQQQINRRARARRVHTSFLIEWPFELSENLHTRPRLDSLYSSFSCLSARRCLSVERVFVARVASSKAQVLLFSSCAVKRCDRSSIKRQPQNRDAPRRPHQPRALIIDHICASSLAPRASSAHMLFVARGARARRIRECLIFLAATVAPPLAPTNRRVAFGLPPKRRLPACALFTSKNDASAISCKSQIEPPLNERFGTTREFARPAQL